MIFSKFALERDGTLLLDDKGTDSRNSLFDDEGKITLSKKEIHLFGELQEQTYLE